MEDLNHQWITEVKEWHKDGIRNISPKFEHGKGVVSAAGEVQQTGIAALLQTRPKKVEALGKSDHWLQVVGGEKNIALIFGLKIDNDSAMKNVLFSVLIMLLAGAVQAQQTGQIAIEVTGVPSQQGGVLAALFDNPEGFPTQVSQGVMTASSDVKNGRSTMVFNNVPFGSYVLAVFHDANGNGQLDTNKKGIPLEALGVSNNVRMKFGPPKYEKAMFDLTTRRIQLGIEMQQYRAGK